VIGALVALAVAVVGAAFYLGRELGKLRTEVERLRVEFRDHTRGEISSHERRYHVPQALRAVPED
jgi:hypothetical protein